MSYLCLCIKSMFSNGEKCGLSSMSYIIFAVDPCFLYFVSYIFFALRTIIADGQTWAPREVGKFSLAHAGFVGRLQAYLTSSIQPYGVLSDKV